MIYLIQIAILWVLGMVGIFHQLTGKVYAGTNDDFNIASLKEGVVYEVGPEKEYTSLHQVPWGGLMPGDKVLIFWREEPYKEKFALSRMGTEEAPITISGVAGPEGQLPVIDGNGATIVTEYSFWNDNRCVVKVGGARFSGSQGQGGVGNLIIENLEIRSAHEDYTYFDRGTEKTYSKNASSIYVEYGENIIIRNNILTDCGNGLFTAHGSENVVVERNYLYNNGVLNSIYEHGVYMAGNGLLFQFNYFGPLKEGSTSIGNNIKTRGAGEVIRYNFIEGGNRAFDLVDGSDFVSLPSYHETHIYGNIIVDNGQGTNSSVVHYGGDSGDTSIYRKGTLYFFNNTVLNMRPQSPNQYIFQLETTSQKLIAHNNIFYFTSNNAFLKSGGRNNGIFELKNNWLVSDWKVGIDATESAYTDITAENTVVGQSPGFVNMAEMDFRLSPESACIDAGTSLHPDVLPAHNVLYHYVKHQSTEERPVDDVPDIGAYEFADEISGIRMSENENLACQIYPNPATDNLILKVNEYNSSKYFFQLFDSNGKVVQNSIVAGKETVIHVGHLKPAVYFLKVYSIDKVSRYDSNQENRNFGINTFSGIQSRFLNSFKFIKK